mgnify:CR=1 FL=1
MKPTRLLTNSINLLSAQVIVVICGVLSTGILSRDLGIDGYGFYILAIDVCLTIAILVDFGLPTWGLRNWDGSSQNAIPIMLRIMRIQVIIATIVSLLAISFVSTLGLVENSTMFAILISSVCIIVFTEPLRVGLRMIGYAKYEAISRSCEKIIITMGYFLLSQSEKMGLIEAASCIFAGSIVTLILTYYLVYSVLNREKNSQTEENRIEFPSIRTIIWEALPFAIAIAALPLLGRIDKLLLGAILEIELVSVYNAAWVVLLTGFIVPNVIRQSITPLLAESTTIESRLIQIIQSKKIVYSLIAIGVPVSIIISEVLLDVIFPDSFIEDREFPEFAGISLFSILLPTWIWSMLACTNFESLKYNENKWALSNVVGLSLTINFVVGLLLVREFSIIGVAIGSICAQFSIFMISSILQVEEIGLPLRLVALEFSMGFLGTIGLILFATREALWDPVFPGDVALLASMYLLMLTVGYSAEERFSPQNVPSKIS